MVRTRFPAEHQPSQQRLLTLRIKRLKNLIEVDIEFDENRPLTAILGPNGFGKSSILHALAASFSLPGRTVAEEGYRFVDFFPNTPHGVWSGTDFIVSHKYRLGPVEHNLAPRIRKETGQWLPLPKNKPVREVHFIGVRSAVPKIETQATRRRIKYATTDLTDEISNEIKMNTGMVFNRDYTKYHANTISRVKKLIGVEYRGVNYSSLAMGAGEQRVFEIFKKVANAGKYAFILIDEIDILLHGDALNRFIVILNKYAIHKNLQIIFTTHREQIVNLNNIVAIRHIYQTPAPPHKTFCFKETKPEALFRLTGTHHRPLEVSCEDDVSSAIIERVAIEVDILPYTEITKFGAAVNCFTLIAALLLNNENLDDSIFVIDGDRFQTETEKIGRINSVLTGDHPADEIRRKSALTLVRQFAPPTIEAPEKRLHSLIRSVNKNGDPEVDAVIDAALEFEIVENSHLYVDKIIDKLGYSREVGLNKIVMVASRSDSWSEYVSSIRDWFQSKAAHVKEHH